MVGLGSVDNTADAAKPVSTFTQTALNLRAPLASPAFTGTVTGITKATVGLATVDNTAATSNVFMVFVDFSTFDRILFDSLTFDRF